MKANKKNPNTIVESLPGFEKIQSDMDFFTFIKKHIQQLESMWDEVFLLVDTKDQIRRDKRWMPMLAYRSDCHQKGGKDAIHRWSNFFITNEKWDLLLSKRADNKDTYPWFLEIGWGHCWLLSYDDTLQKELKEELWIASKNIKTIKKIMKSLIVLPIQQEYIQFYEIQLKKWVKIHIDNKEVKKSVWYSKEKIIEHIQNGSLKFIPDQTISILNYLLTKSTIKNTKKIKDMIKKQKEICRKQDICIKNIQIF